jgi:hypothetical protein
MDAEESHKKPATQEKIKLEQAKDAVVAWAHANGGPAVAKDALAKHFGIKMSEMDESQAEAVFIHFTGGEIDPAELMRLKQLREAKLRQEREAKQKVEQYQRQEKLIERIGGELLDATVYWSHVADVHSDPTPALVEGVLVEGQPLLLAGPKKTQKTVIGLDLAVSLTTATPFLGRFPVREPRKVLYLSGESGQAAVATTLSRIAEARGATPSEDLTLCFRRVQFTKKGERDKLRALIEFYGADVVLIDPAYLSMQGLTNPSSYFEVGEHLAALSRVGEDTGATVGLIAHCGKSKPSNIMPRLDDVAWAGFGEWARQWVLVNNRREWQAGQANLNLVTGHACHAGEYRLTIDVGQPLWSRYDVAVEDLNAAPEAKTDAAPSRHLKTLLAALDGDEFQSVNSARGVTGLNGVNARAAIEEGLAAELIEQGKTEKGGVGYRVRQGDNPVTLPLRRSGGLTG